MGSEPSTQLLLKLTFPAAQSPTDTDKHLFVETTQTITSYKKISKGAVIQEDFKSEDKLWLGKRRTDMFCSLCVMMSEEKRNKKLKTDAG